MLWYKYKYIRIWNVIKNNKSEPSFQNLAILYIFSINFNLIEIIDTFSLIKFSQISAILSFLI